MCKSDMKKNVSLSNKIIMIAVIAIQIFITLFLLVGCNSEYKKTDCYVIFDDGIGNTYKVKGKERLKEDVSTRMFSSTIYYNNTPDAVYTFTAELYKKDGDTKLDESQTTLAEPYVSTLYLTDKASYESIQKGGKSFAFDPSTDTNIELYGSEPGTYYLLKYMKYKWDHGDNASWYPIDYYFLVVHIS